MMILILPQVAGLQQRLLIATSVAAEPSSPTPGEGCGGLHLGATGWSIPGVGKCWGNGKYGKCKVIFHMIRSEEWEDW